MGPVWSHDGIICTGESYTKAVKLTFAKGAALKIRPSLQLQSRRKTSAAQSIFTKERPSTSPPSRRSFARQSPSTTSRQPDSRSCRQSFIRRRRT